VPDFDDILIIWTDFLKILKYKFQENPSTGSPFIPCGRTDGRTERHDEVNTLRTGDADLRF